jgi:protein TonB
MMEGYLIHQVEPVYPRLARAAGVEGTVELRAVITRQGTIEKLQVLRGPPLLVKAAVDAVAEWRYRPYVLNGEPVEVDTDVTVKFSLSRGWPP